MSGLSELKILLAISFIVMLIPTKSGEASQTFGRQILHPPVADSE
jgi:hypothetical protein